MSGGEASVKGRCFLRLLDGLPAADTDIEAHGWFVPGRVEVLGKHTDYAGGRSLVCAVERGICLVMRPRADDLLRIADLTTPGVFETHLGETSPGIDEGWRIYPSTVVRRVTRNFPSAIRGADIVFQSDLPSCGGLSSSSALVVAILLALAAANALEATESWREAIHDCETLAGYAAAIENGQSHVSLPGDAGVGTAGGSEDHTAILCSRPGILGQYSFCPVRGEGGVALPPDLLFAVAVSGVVAQKTGNARALYNRAARLAARLLELLNQGSGRRDGSLAAALRSGQSAEDLRAMLGRASDPEFSRVELLNRFDQFVEESEQLVPSAAARLRSADLVGFGRTVARSHELAETLLRNQVPETTALVTHARTYGAIAASAFGAGFGGSVWALVTRSDASAFLDRWTALYRSAHPDAATRSTFFLTRPGPSALRLRIEG
jgi:galactokinase